ncbi:hypothetical protein M2171_004724 [Bradyrhizobium japonicum USDA 38]|uniref:hypothetical protein n=1 Tax=Bradyrhizobium japonicum TaxID=375 RepID=UPI0012BD5A85|nr:hypothetical protein [Bradyrhizobium japonicum]MCS3895591.1 hypothetical protein [Bradyrhizobium japonicum USDA 38]MCS3948106.1 hypothetical protein [Bradyrhizobium japonicum]
MRFLLCLPFVAAVSMTPAFAAPPASCASKFIGEWRHSGGNKGTLTADGRAICSEHAACQSEGTWTCSGNNLTYTTSLGSWVYTLQPDGSITANGGIARAVRIGRAPAAPAKPAQIGSSEAAVVGNENLKSAKPTRDCSGVSGKVDGVELKPMKCDDVPAKAAALAPAPTAQPAKPTQITSGTVAGSKRALDAIADISPDFKKALENASLSLENAKIDPSRVKEPAVKEAETRPARVEAKSSPDNSPSQQTADAPQDQPREIADLDPEDYAKKCRDESFESGLKSLKQDIAAATKSVTLERDPKNKKTARGLKFYLEKYKLVKKVLKRCAVEVLNRQVIDPIERSGILADIADDPQ